MFQSPRAQATNAASATSQRWVHRTLLTVGGEATLGDLVTITGLSGREIVGVLDAMIVDGSGHLRVSESGDVTYHLGHGPEARRDITGAWGEARAGAIGFDRKTAQLIRAREGVISIAELVEHTGLTVDAARVEMRRLADCFGGTPHTSLDGHVVYAFPDLMTSAHAGLRYREPRPAWVRCEDPMASSRGGPLARLVHGLTSPLRRVAWLRLHRRATVRRYLLGLVFETALAGKGVVSLHRAAQYLSRRAGGLRVRLPVVERALRGLAREFDAPITELGGDVFFGFRSVKRQFLASLLVRRELQLGRMVWGRTVFDTSDPPLTATLRDLEAFDRALSEGPRHGRQNP